MLNQQKSKNGVGIMQKTAFCLLILNLVIVLLLTGCGGKEITYNISMDNKEPFMDYHPRFDPHGQEVDAKSLARAMAEAYLNKCMTDFNIPSQILADYKIKSIKIEDNFGNRIIFTVRFNAKPKSPDYIAQNGKQGKNGWINDRYYLMTVEKINNVYYLTKVEINRY